MNKIMLIICGILYAATGMAQGNSDVLWSHLWGGQGTNEFYAVVETSDGGFAFAGYTGVNSAGGKDYWLVKTDANGDKLWEKSYGGPGHDIARCMKQTPDGGYILSGRTTSYGAGEDDIWTIKTDAQGEVEWEKLSGIYGWDIGFDLHLCADGGYYICGETWEIVNDQWTAHAFILKIDSSGEEQWWHKASGVHREIYFAQTLTSDDCIVAVGFTMSFGAVYGIRDYFLVKINQEGQELWRQAINGIGGDDWGRDIVETDDGGFVIAGASRDAAQTKFDLCVFKTDSQGTVEWKKVFGEAENAWGRAIVKCDDGGFILSGKIGPQIDGSQDDCLLIKIDGQGEELWRKRWGNSGTQAEEAITIGWASDGGLMVAGSRKYSNIKSDGLLMKYATESLTAVSEAASPRALRLVGNYPNPFNPTTTICFELPAMADTQMDVYNAAGQWVASLLDEVMPAGSHTLNFNAEDLPSGVYLCRFSSGHAVRTQKLLLMK